MKILLVDDEKLLLDSLEASIPWSDYGLEVIGKACNGLQALEICESQQPDLVITDVKMGQMDGIQLARELNYRYPDIKVILLSAYDDFKFAQQAVELNVSKYILKLEAGKDTLLQAILDIKDTNCHSGNSHMELQEYENVVVNKSLKRIIHDLASDKDWQWWNDTSAKMDLERIIVYVIRIDLEMEDSADELRGILGRIGGLVCNGLGTVSNGVIYYITAMTDSSSDMVRRQAIRMKSMISMNYGNCSIGIAHSLDAGELKTGIKWAEKALEWSFYTGRGSLNFAQEREERSINPVPYHKFIIDIHCNNYQRIRKNLIQIFEECEKKFCYEKRQLIALVEYVFLSLDEGNTDTDSHDWVIASMENLGKVVFLIDLKRLTDSGLELFQKKKQLWKSESKIVQASIDFILLNYERSLSLAEISEHIFVSSSYLSKLFKKEMGMTLTAFIHHIKIKYAKEMLITEPQKSVTEISGQLGFDSSSYFSYIFERMEGITPTDYRRKSGIKEDTWKNPI